MMKLLTTAMLASVVALGAADVASAHHSFPATYYVDRTQTITGRVVGFLFRNPHSFVQVMAPDPKGQMQRWAVEWSAGAALAGQGVTGQTIRVGDGVTVTGNPARAAEDHRLRMNKITRAGDGWKWEGVVE